MLEEKHRRFQIPQYESLYDLKVLDVGSVSGHNWTSMIQENCLATHNQFTKKEEFEPTRKRAWLGMITIFLLCSAPMWILTSKLTQIGQQINSQSIEK